MLAHRVLEVEEGPPALAGRRAVALVGAAGPGAVLRGKGGRAPAVKGEPAAVRQPQGVVVVGGGRSSGRAVGT